MLRLEGARLVLLAVCLAQMVQAKHVPVVLLVSVLLPVASSLRQEAFLLPREAHGPLCLLQQVRLAVPHLPPVPLDSRQLLLAESRLCEQQPGLVEEHSWDSPS